MIDLEVFLSMKSIRKPLMLKVILEADSVLQSSFKMEKKPTKKPRDRQSDTIYHLNLPLLIENLHLNWLIFLP